MHGNGAHDVPEYGNSREGELRFIYDRQTALTWSIPALE